MTNKLKSAAELIMSALTEASNRTIPSTYFIMFYYDENKRLNVYDTRDLHRCHTAIISKHPTYRLVAVENFSDERAARGVCASIRLTEKFHERFLPLLSEKLNNE